MLENATIKKSVKSSLNCLHLGIGMASCDVFKAAVTFYQHWFKIFNLHFHEQTARSAHKPPFYSWNLIRNFLIEKLPCCIFAVAHIIENTLENWAIAILGIKV